jgi:pimeloyl-ACP methyl ester carboxylesterase
MSLSLPADFDNLTEATSIALGQAITFVPVQTGLIPEPIQTAIVRGNPSDGDPSGQNPSERDRPLLLFLAGFDSSLLEFRRLWPLLSADCDPWLMDLLGFGFTERPLNIPYNPQVIQQHLYAFWQQHLHRPLILVGASMGGAVALEFALSYPDAVAQVVLLDGAGIQNGPLIGKYLVSPFDRWAVNFLRRSDVRRNISKNAYFDPDKLVTPDAELCASLHLQMPGWDEALRRFTRSGGYPSVRSRLSQISQPTLILWGRQDRILGTRDAEVFAQQLPQSQLTWIEDCGHVPHLEQPEATAQAILAGLY